MGPHGACVTPGHGGDDYGNDNGHKAPQIVHPGLHAMKAHYMPLSNRHSAHMTKADLANSAHNVTKQQCTCSGSVEYPCYVNGGCYSITDEDSCTGSGGEYCQREECTVANCEMCSVDGTTCEECAEGYMGEACESEDSFFADVSVKLLPGGVVGLASAKLFQELQEGFLGGGGTWRGTAMMHIAQAFTRFFKDEFTFVYVYPHEKLQGSVTHQEFWGAPGLGGTSTVQGVIAGGQPM